MPDEPICAAHHFCYKEGDIRLSDDKQKAFDQLTATLIHEVKNPVSVIKANIDYIYLNNKSDEYKKNYEIIEKELNRISDLLNDFNQLTKPVDFDLSEPIYIYDVLEDIISDYQVTLKNREIKFEIFCDNRDINFKGEYSKIGILFFNIYKNAAEAIKEKGTIKTFIRKKDDKVIIDVEDDGEGIDPHIADIIGEPFITTKKTGSGLGILICKNIVGEHGGNFQIKNNKGKGCVVTITFNL